MADNVEITAGSGTIVKTDQVGTDHVQYVKLMDGTADGSGVIPGDATNGLDVDVTRLPALVAGEAHAGAIGGNMVSVDVVPTLTVAATYVANDYVGTSGTAMTFAACARVNAGTGIIQSAVLVDYALQSITCELWLFDTAPTPPNDSAAWSITDAHAARCIGVVQFSTYFASALNSISQAHNLGIAFKAAAGATALYGCLVTRGAPAYASGDLTVRLMVLQD